MLVKYDSDITQEQASYLANFTMNLLTDVGGRMMFHQVAAKGFNKVAKASQKVAQASKAARKVGQSTKVASGEVARVERIIKGTSPQVQEAYASAKAWLGEDYRVIVNKRGDYVLISKDGLRKFRTDLKDKKYPPHVHLQELRNGEWDDAVPGKHHIYPKGD